MHQCPRCQKQFKTRNSLTRHARNHTPRARQIACPTCNVVFARKDILNRHLRQSHPATSSGITPRSRCHTACEPCRRNRTRCDGRDPCSSCAQRAWDCTWTTASRRVSRAAPGNTADGSDEAFEAEEDHQGLDSSSVAVEDGITQAPSLPESSLTDMPAPAAPGQVSWPWLHETEYLQVGYPDWTIPNIHNAMSVASLDNVSNTPASSAEHMTWPMPLHSTEAAITPVPQPRASGDASLKSTRTSCIQENADTLVNLATSAAFSHNRSRRSRSEWLSTIRELSFLLQDETPARNGDDILHYFAKLYMDHFNPLWPMVSQWQLDFERFHPILLLTMASIGAMYGIGDSHVFGSSMHERLRRLLAAALFDLEGPDDDLRWLAQARVLTQVHALYFGQRQAFSYAQVKFPPLF